MLLIVSLGILLGITYWAIQQHQYTFPSKAKIALQHQFSLFSKTGLLEKEAVAKRIVGSYLRITVAITSQLFSMVAGDEEQHNEKIPVLQVDLADHLAFGEIIVVSLNRKGYLYSKIFLNSIRQLIEKESNSTQPNLLLIQSLVSITNIIDGNQDTQIDTMPNASIVKECKGLIKQIKMIVQSIRSRHDPLELY